MSQPQEPGARQSSDKSKWPIYLGAGCGCLVIVGVLLATVGIPAFIQYIKRSKSMEAESNLQALASLVEDTCESRGSFAGLSPAGPIPAVPNETKQPADFQSDPVFADIGFGPSPVFFSYSITGTESGIDLVAEGDLDGDGLRSRRAVHCVTVGCRCDPTPTVSDELE